MIEKFLKTIYDGEGSKTLNVSWFAWLHAVGFTVFGVGSFCLGLLIIYVSYKGASGFDKYLFYAFGLFLIVCYVTLVEYLIKLGEKRKQYQIIQYLKELVRGEQDNEKIEDISKMIESISFSNDLPDINDYEGPPYL